MEVWKDFFSKKEMAMTWDSAVKKSTRSDEIESE